MEEPLHYWSLAEPQGDIRLVQLGYYEQHVFESNLDNFRMGF